MELDNEQLLPILKSMKCPECGEDLALYKNAIQELKLSEHQDDLFKVNFHYGDLLESNEYRLVCANEKCYFGEYELDEDPFEGIPQSELIKEDGE